VILLPDEERAYWKAQRRANYILLALVLAGTAIGMGSLLMLLTLFRVII